MKIYVKSSRSTKQSEAKRGQILSVRKLFEIVSIPGPLKEGLFWKDLWSSHIVWGIHTFMCFIWAEDVFEAVEVAEELLLLLKKDQPFIIPPEADPEPEVDEPDPDVPYLFKVEDEVLCPPIFDEFLLLELILLEL